MLLVSKRSNGCRRVKISDDLRRLPRCVFSGKVTLVPASFPKISSWLVFFVVLVFCGIAAAEAPRPLDPASQDWEGLSGLVELAQGELGPGRVVVSRRLDYSSGLRPGDGILLVHPDVALDTDSLSRFMKDGGRVVLLDDFGTGDELLLHFGIDRVPLPARPAEMLRHNPALAIAEPASEHSVVWGVGRVVTNHATGLRHPDLSPVLEVRGDGEPDVLVALAGAVGKGRLLAMGDGSLFMNSMLRYPGNRALAAGVVRYAVEDDTNGPRGGRLWIVSGAFEQAGTYGDDGSLDVAFKTRLRAVAEAFAAFKREGAPPLVAYITAVAVGLGLIVWIGSRAGRPHVPASPRYTRPIPLVAQGGVAGHVAVISAPGTSRVLAMLEVKSALEDDLCELLGLERNPGHEVLLEDLGRRRLLDASELSELKALLLALARTETLVLSRRGSALGAVRDAEVVEAARVARRIVQRARARLG